jgi:glycerophosphoryl diester phosphodiesterase
MERLAATRRPLLVAHRGSSGSAPENTLASFRQAVADGADMIELDVRLSRDGHLVVLHDRTVNRTTNGRGKVWDLTLDELKALDAGSWFGKRFAGEHIPTLNDVVELLPSDLPINIEVKTDGQPRTVPPFESRLVHFIRDMGIAHRIIVSSFDHAFLRRLHRLDRSFAIGVLYLPLRDMGRTPSALAHNVGGSVFTCSITQLRARMVADAVRTGIVLGCYGVNTRRQLEKAMSHGVRVIITDYPREMRRYIG